MTDSVLIVDDDVNLLQAYQRRFRARFSLECAQGGEQGLEMCRQRGPFAVVVSDRQMPGMDGTEFLARLRDSYPDIVRIMLTGGATLESAVDAVNTGHIFRFLLKPCQLDTLALTIEAGIHQHRLITAERELLTKTLSGSIKLLADFLSISNPTAFGRSSRVRRIVQRILREMPVEQFWACEIAAILCQIGCVRIPQETLERAYRDEDLSIDELRAYCEHPVVGHKLMVNIPRLEGVAEIIGYQNKCFDGTGVPDDGRRGAAIPIGARILKVALDFDTLCNRSESELAAFVQLASRSGWYDPAVLNALQRTLNVGAPCVIRSFRITDLPDNAVLAEDVRSRTGQLLIAKGIEVTTPIRDLLVRSADSHAIVEPLRVLLPAVQIDGPESSSGISAAQSL